MGSQRHAPVALPPAKTRDSLCRRLGGPQCRSGRVRKISPPPGFDLPTVLPVASHYTDWAIPAPCFFEVGTQFIGSFEELRKVIFSFDLSFCPRSHGWYICQTFVTGGYLPCRWSDALATLSPTSVFPTGYQSMWHNCAESPGFVGWCVQTGCFHGSFTHDTQSIRRVAKYTSHGNAVTMTRPTFGKCTRLQTSVKSTGCAISATVMPLASCNSVELFSHLSSTQAVGTQLSVLKPSHVGS